MSSSSVDSNSLEPYLQLTLGLPGFEHLEAPPAPAPVPASFEAVLALPAPVIDLNVADLDHDIAPPVVPPEPLGNRQWDIKKTLTKSDVGNHSRLLIAKNKASDHIMRALSVDDQKKVQRTKGLPIKVLDVDTNREVTLNLKVLQSSQAYVLNGLWKKEFVNERGLVKDDVIGLRYWRQPGDEEGKLLFKVLTERE